MKNFLISSKNPERDSFIWNTIGSVVLSLQSFILLIVSTRTLSIEDSGIFNLAYANAIMFLYLGYYGVRPFMVSDAKKEFSFGEYCTCRFFTIILMLFLSLIFDVFSSFLHQYSIEKSLILFLMVVFKTADVAEDTYTAFYQQKNRLDIGAKVTTVRVAITTIFFGICIYIFHNLLTSLILSILFTYFLVFFQLILTKGVFGKDMNLSKGFLRNGAPGACSLLRICFSLCIGTVLPFVIQNIPKYAVDSVLNDEMQAYYGFISMPASVIPMFLNVIFYPTFYSMTRLWIGGKFKQFIKKVVNQVGILFCFTVFYIGVAYLVGIPVLSVIYQSDLQGYRSEMLFLIAGGGLMALSELLNYQITIIRCQRHMEWIYVFVAIFAALFSNPIIRMFGFQGAAYLYVISFLLLCICLIVIFVFGIFKSKKNLKILEAEDDSNGE